MLMQTVEKLKALGPIYMTVDSFAFLVLDRKIIPAEAIAGVFPWPGHEAVTHLPHVTPEIDTLCRKVASYYWHLHYHQVTDWDGHIRSFEHKAANTVSYRAYAPYQVVKREMRARMAPAHPDKAAVLQFDWTAAEWLLILQHVGYQAPEGDPYQQDLFGVPRDEAKKIILPRIYGATVEGLASRHPDIGYQTIQQVVQRLEAAYPMACEWVHRLIHDPNYRWADFHGFHLDLGEEAHKRPNRWAQTSLQLCKWDLIGRLNDLPTMNRIQEVRRGRMTIQQPWSLAAGDIHDQLVFDIYQGDEQTAHEIINQIRSPCFGSVKLLPKFSTGKSWS